MDVSLDIDCLIFHRIQDDRLGLTFLRIFERHDDSLFPHGLFFACFLRFAWIRKGCMEDSKRKGGLLR